MPRVYEHRCRMCGCLSILDGFCRMCKTPYPKALHADIPTTDKNDPTTTPPDEDCPHAPESHPDPAPDQPPEGHGPYDDDFPGWVDLGAGG